MQYRATRSFRDDRIGGAIARGAVVDAPELLARDLIASGLVVPVEPAPAKKAAPVLENKAAPAHAAKISAASPSASSQSSAKAKG